MPARGSVSVPAAVAIGVGGMVGAGIFSVLGVAAESAGNALPLSFLIGGVVTAFSAYSYAKLGAAFPSSGGAVEFLVRGFGRGTLSGGLNLFLWVGYVIALALYASAFGAYGRAMFGGNPDVWGVLIVALFTGVNAVGSRAVGRWESLIVALKLVILALFAFAGAFSLQPARLSPAEWPPFASVIMGAGIVFMGYEGFGLVANAGGAMANPKRDLPRALYLSVGLVTLLYLVVSAVAIGNLSIPDMLRAKDYALAQAARPVLGEWGFRLVGIAALLSTASAVNATLFGAANVAGQVATDGELPARLDQPLGKAGSAALWLTSVAVIGFLLLFDLAGIAMMGAAAFLLFYAAVNGAHLRLLKETGARAWPVWVAIAGCLTVFGFLAVYTAQAQPSALWAIAGLLPVSFLAEWVFQSRVRSRAG